MFTQIFIIFVSDTQFTCIYSLYLFQVHNLPADIHYICFSYTIYLQIFIIFVSGTQFACRYSLYLFQIHNLPADIHYICFRYTIYLQIYMLFMFFWLMNFIVALGQMTLAGAFASYYWAYEKPRDIPATPLAKALYRSLR